MDEHESNHEDNGEEGARAALAILDQEFDPEPDAEPAKPPAKGRQTKKTGGVTKREATSVPNDEARRPTIDIEPEDRTRLREIAKRMGMPMLDALTAAINLLEDRNKEERAETRLERINRASGRSS
jgi:hypothetical protein